VRRDAGPLRSLREHLDLLRRRGELREVSAEVDPNLELAEVHRRVVARGGPALLFRRPKGSSFPVATNLFGTEERVAACFGPRPKDLIERLVDAAHHALPPTPGKLWRLRGLAWQALRVGLRDVRRGPTCAGCPC
jgi:UbiD family decarboxylase